MYYTFLSKSITCPYWNIEVSLRAKYRYVDNGPIATFMYSTCPIIENQMLPLSEQSIEYELMRCPFEHGCEMLKNFEREVDLRKDVP